MEATFLKESYVIAEFTPFGAVYRHRRSPQIVDGCRVSVGEHRMVEELLTVSGKLCLQDFLHSCGVRLSRCNSLLVKHEDVLESLRTLTCVAILWAHSHVL
jgi:hypothetical protein